MKERWEFDKLNRKTDAELLTKYLSARYKSSEVDKNSTFILNINADWGNGKTYFLTNWKGDLETKDHLVVYYDAWKNDASENPLLSVLTAIQNQLTDALGLETKAKESLDSVMNYGKKVALKSLPILLNILVRGLTGVSPISLMEDKEEGEQSEKSSVGATEYGKLVDKVAENAINNYELRSSSIDSFKEKLSSFVTIVDSIEDKNLPIYIFIDELDRCRPNYAIELLESVKHLFEVSGIYFVVATDSRQLEESIKAIYGSGFDSHRYLKRFFDQEYNFVEPDYLDYSRYLHSREKIETDKTIVIIASSEQHEEEDPSVTEFAKLSEYFILSLRDQEQIYKLFYYAVATWPLPTIHRMYLLYLLMLKQKSNDLFEKYACKFTLKPLITTTDHLKCNSDTWIQTMNRDRDSSVYSPVEKNIRDIMTYYDRYTKSTPASLSGHRPNSHIEGNILSALSNEGVSGANYFSLINYPTLVKKAGQMS